MSSVRLKPCQFHAKPRHQVVCEPCQPCVVAVVGVPDEQWGEAVAAVVVLKAGQSTSAAELKQWVKDRLRSSRTPERITFVDELPYNETGKLLRRRVRADLMQAD